MIKKPRERGGHSPRWAAVPEMMMMMMIMMMIIIINVYLYFTNYDVSLFFRLD
jgi:ABC-type sugar transport system permease subunit